MTLGRGVAGSRRFGGRAAAAAAVTALLVTVAVAAWAVRSSGPPDPVAVEGQAAVPPAGAPAGTPDTPRPPSINVSASVAAMSPKGRREAYDLEVAEGRGRIDRLEAYLGRFPRALTDVDALAGEWRTPEAAFAFVRDAIAFEPHPGVMKGARGTLLTRGGNALDRALLLAAILKRNSVSARIAHARLGEDQTRQLVQAIASAPGATTRILASVNALDIPTSNMPGQQELTDALERRAGLAARTVEQAVNGNRPLIEASLKSAGLAGVDDGERQARQALTDHYWVQAIVEGQTVDLDPATAGARVGQRLADESDTLDPDSLPGDLFQHVRFRLVADLHTADGVRATDVRQQEFTAIELFGKNIRVVIAPQATSATEATCHAILIVGDRRIGGVPIQLSGQPPAGQGSGADLGGLFGALGGESDEKSALSQWDGCRSRSSVEDRSAGYQLSARDHGSARRIGAALRNRRRVRRRPLGASAADPDVGWGYLRRADPPALPPADRARHHEGAAVDGPRRGRLPHRIEGVAVTIVAEHPGPPPQHRDDYFVGSMVRSPGLDGGRRPAPKPVSPPVGRDAAFLSTAVSGMMFFQKVSTTRNS